MGKVSEDKHKNIKNLVKLNDELENYFRNTVIPQLFVDADLILRKFTPPAMKHFNLSSADVGRHIEEIYNNIRYPTIIENIKEVIESKQDLEKEIQTTDKMWYQMNILPYLIQKENKANGVIITFVDITDRIESLKRYEKLNLRYENIIYSVAHDFKGPLSNLEGLIKMLKDVPDHKKEDSKMIINMVGLSVRYLRKAIEELTDFNMESNDSAGAVERVNFEDIVEDVQLALKDKIYETDAKVITEFKVSDVGFSRKNIRSIVYNLLSNAIKYKVPDRVPEILIKTEKLNDYILMSVRDNGRGIAEDKQEIIFSRHTRISHDVEGTGVGLFIVKRMVEDGGGKIEVESSLGEGSTFKVYLKK
ncbi:sensor histidine kinase [Nafulsella turpanensis]|uniref:sensor histidine kinase n=1 Tax=Nafulsella turpanensis TaxID=1265690 RepID=UPI0003462E75|nr:PAS domain-containing protein [Nafulsella turpanensis]